MASVTDFFCGKKTWLTCGCTLVTVCSRVNTRPRTSLLVTYPCSWKSPFPSYSYCSILISCWFWFTNFAVGVQVPKIRITRTPRPISVSSLSKFLFSRFQVSWHGCSWNDVPLALRSCSNKVLYVTLSNALPSEWPAPYFHWIAAVTCWNNPWEGHFILR